MSAPTNISAATAFVIGSLPFSNTQRVDDAGTTYTVWYKYTGVSGQLGVGVFAFEDNLLDIYIPTIDVFESDGVTPYRNISAAERRIQFGIGSAVIIYFRIKPNAGNPTPAELGVLAYATPTSSIASGDILVNDDTNGFPGVIIRSDGSGGSNLRNIVFPLAVGEGGDILTSGAILLNNFPTSELKFYSSDLDLVATVGSVTSDPKIRVSQGLQHFYAGWRTGGVTTVRSYNNLGVQQTTVNLTGAPTLLGFAPNNDGTIFYLANNSSGAAVQSFNGTTGALINATFIAGAVGRWIPDILVLSDGTIIYSSINIVTGALDIFRYNAAGVLQNTYALGTTLLPASTFPRLAFAANGVATSFWIWTHEDPAGGGDIGGLSRFREIRVSDGVVLQNFTSPEYEGGIMQPNNQALGNFGISFSCPFVVMGTNNVITANNTDGSLFVSSTPPPVINNRSGIYKIVPAALKRNDTLWQQDFVGTDNVKIPNPFAKSALLGE